MKSLILIINLQIIFIFFVGCSKSMVLLSGQTMGTTYSIKYWSNLKDLNKLKVHKKVEFELHSVNQTMSTYVKDSELSRLNKSDKINEWINISPDLFIVLTEAKYIHMITKGAFDITIGPLVNIWGFGPLGRKKKPTDGEISKILKKIGTEKFSIKKVGKKYLFKKQIKDLYLDLSAIAKGFGVDEIASSLERLGIINYLIEVGGEVKTKGVKNNGKKWKIAVEAPLEGERSYNKIISLSNKSIATSGNYRNFFKKDGIKFHHTIDPHTGRPVNRNIKSATVISKKSCMRADALATAFMVLGEVEGQKIANDLNISTFFIYSEGVILKEAMSHRFKEESF